MTAALAIPRGAAQLCPTRREKGFQCLSNGDIIFIQGKAVEMQHAFGFPITTSINVPAPYLLSMVARLKVGGREKPLHTVPFTPDLTASCPLNGF
jgi:hypothetical protein